MCHWLCQCFSGNLPADGSFWETVNHRQVGMLPSCRQIEVVSGRPRENAAPSFDVPLSTSTPKTTKRQGSPKHRQSLCHTTSALCVSATPPARRPALFPRGSLLDKPAVPPAAPRWARFACRFPGGQPMSTGNWRTPVPGSTLNRYALEERSQAPFFEFPLTDHLVPQPERREP